MFAGMSQLVREEREKAIERGEDPDKAEAEVTKTAIGVAVGSTAFGLKGVAIGAFIGGPVGAFIGFTAGSIVGAVIGGSNPKRAVLNAATGIASDIAKPPR